MCIRDRFNATVNKLDGQQVDTEVIRVGAFNIVGPDGYINYDLEVSALVELSRQPSAQFSNTADDLYEADTNDLISFAVDQTRCSLLSLEIHRAASTRVPTPDLNDLLTDLKNRRQPPHVGRFRPKLRYITQVEIQPPTFLIFGTNTDKLQTHYESYIINNIRQAFGFEGAPIRVFYRANAKFRKGEVK